MIDLVILDYSTNEVVFVKADEQEIAEKYNNSVEKYIQQSLDYNLGDIEYMCSDCMTVHMFGGIPFGGVEQTMDSFFD